MSVGGDPKRLLDSEGLGEALRTDLSRAAEHDVGYDVQAGLARFEASLAGGPPSGGGGGGEGAAAAASGGTLTLVVGLAVGLAAGGGAIAWSQRGGGEDQAEEVVAREREASVEIAEVSAMPEPPAAAMPEQGEESVAVEEVPGGEEVQGGEEVPTAGSGPQPEPAPAAGPGRSRAPASAPAPTTDDDRLRREMKATDRARQALASDPGRALTLVRKANREFEGGLFGEDREGIAILALFGLGREAEARRRASAFLRAHPRSSYADKIRAAMEGAGEP